MKKEEFINLALNSELRILTNEGSIEKIKGVIGGAYCINDFPKYGMYGDCVDANLILRPLSDLTKEIEHNGEKFLPIEKIAYSFGYEIRISRNNLLQPIMCEQFNVVLQLIKWHFDIAGLIEKGEAIDVNTLTENPYK